MSSITDELFYHTKLYHKHLRALFKPLEEYFGVTEACVHFVTDNLLINIHTHAKWMEFCMEKEYFKDDPHIVNKELIRVGFTLCSYYPSQKYIDGIVKDAMMYDMHHGVTYAKKTKSGYNAICIDTTAKNIDMPNKIINNQKYIIKFMTYLEKALQPILNNLTDRAIDIDSLKESKYFSQNKELKEKQQIEISNRIKFLKQLGIIAADVTNFSLSEKEKICLRYYLVGKTASDTAQELSISRRTVENYIESIKNKLNCRYKKDLFEKIDVLDCLGMLD